MCESIVVCHGHQIRTIGDMQCAVFWILLGENRQFVKTNSENDIGSISFVTVLLDYKVAQCPCGRRWFLVNTCDSSRMENGKNVGKTEA